MASELDYLTEELLKLQTYAAIGNPVEPEKEGRLLGDLLPISLLVPGLEKDGAKIAEQGKRTAKAYAAVAASTAESIVQPVLRLNDFIDKGLVKVLQKVGAVSGSLEPVNTPTNYVNAYYMLENTLGEDFAAYYQEYKNQADAVSHFGTAVAGGVALSAPKLLGSVGVGWLARTGANISVAGASLGIGTGLQASRLATFASNWERYSIAKNGLQLAKNSDIWRLSAGTWPKFVGVNIVDLGIQTAFVDALVTGGLIFHPYVEDKNADELFAQLPYTTALGAGIGGIVGLFKYHSVLRELAAAQAPVKLISGYNALDQSKSWDTLISESIPGSEIAALAKFKENFMQHIVPGVDPKDTATISGLVQDTVGTKLLNAFNRVTKDNSNVRPLYEDIIEGRYTADSISHLYHHVAKITRVSGETQGAKVILPGTSAGQQYLESLVFDRRSGVFLPDTAYPTIGDAVQMRTSDGAIKQIIKDRATNVLKVDEFIAPEVDLSLRNMKLSDHASEHVSANVVYNLGNLEKRIDTLIESAKKTQLAAPIVRGTNIVEPYYVEDVGNLPIFEATIARAINDGAEVVQIANKTMSLTEAQDLFTKVRARLVTEQLNAGVSPDKVAVYLGVAPEEVVDIAATGLAPKTFRRADDLINNHTTQNLYRFTYSDLPTPNPRNPTQIAGVELSTLARTVVSDAENLTKVSQSARMFAAQQVLRDDVFYELQNLERRLDISGIDTTRLPNSTFLRPQKFSLYTQEAILSRVSTLVTEEILHVRKAVEESGFAGVLKQMTSGPTDVANVRFQAIALEIFDHNVKTGKPLFYLRDASGKITEIVSKDIYLAEMALRNGANNPEQLAKLQKAVADTRSNGVVIDVPVATQKIFEALAFWTNSHASRANHLRNASAKLGANIISEDQVVLYRPKGNFQAFIRRPEGSFNDDGEMVMLTARTKEELEDKIEKAKRIYQVHYGGGITVEAVRSYDPKVSAEFKKLEGLYDRDMDFFHRMYDPLVHENKGKLLYSSTPTASFELLNAQLEGLQDTAVKQVKDAVTALFAPKLAQLSAMHASAQKSYSPLFTPGPLTYADNVVAPRGTRTPWGDAADMILGNPSSSQYVGKLWQDVNYNTAKVFDYVISKVTSKLPWNSKVNPEGEAEFLKQLDKAYYELGYDRNAISAILTEVAKDFKNPAIRGDFVKQQKYFDHAITTLKSFFNTTMIVLDAAAASLNVFSSPIAYLPVFRDMVRELNGRNAGKAFSDWAKDTYAMEEFGKGLYRIFNKRDKITANDWIGQSFPSAIGQTRREFLDSLKVYDTAPKIANNFKGLEDGLDILGKKLSVENIIAAGDAVNGTQLWKSALQGKFNPLSWLVNLTAATEYLVRVQLADLALEGAKRAKLDPYETVELIAQTVQLGAGARYAAQRPEIFRGSLGRAATTFQSYSFNLANLLLRGIENGDKVAVLGMIGLQAGIHGAKSLPFFDWYMKAAFGEQQRNHPDIYTTAPQIFGRDLSNFLLYGAASNIFSVGLYSRGDMTPRNTFIIPPNPLDWAPFSMLSRAVTSAREAAKFISAIPDGENIGAGLMRYLEHNAINRPLAAMFARIQGFTTSTKLGTVNYVYDTDEILKNTSAGVVQKLLLQAGMDNFNSSWLTFGVSVLGARPLNEEIMRDSIYRYQYYQMKAAEQRKVLSQAMSTIFKDESIYSDPDRLYKAFMEAKIDYIKAGGNDRGFKQAWKRAQLNASRGAFAAISNKLTTPQHQSLYAAIGADPLKVPPKLNYWYPGKAEAATSDE